MSVYDLGYIECTQDYLLYPQYEEGCRVFCDTFLEEARALCPVRTGYLRSTISADYTSTYDIICEVEADYAQYVEYGTSLQSAQPYFEPALDMALAAAESYWDEAEREAIERQRELVQRGRELEERTTHFANAWYSEITGLNFIMIMLIYFLLILLMWAIENLMNSLFEVYDETFREQPSVSHNFSSVSSFVDVY